MMTWRRRLLRLLPHLGLHVSEVADGTILLARRGGFHVTELEPGSWVVSSLAGSPDLQIIRSGKGANLVFRPRQARKDVWDLQQHLYSFLTTEHVAGILRSYAVNCVLDVGAHVGEYAKTLRRAGYTGRIASFEPVPHFAEKLRQAAEADPEWHVYDFALGRENTISPMHVVPIGTVSSLRPPSAYGSLRLKRLRQAQTQEVKVCRLDDVLDTVLEGIDEPRPYLKLDTQGYDLEAFAGAGDRIRAFTGMQSEVALLRIYEEMPRMPEAVTVYEKAGFEVTGMFPVSREKRTGRVLEFDCVMVRTETLPA